MGISLAEAKAFIEDAKKARESWLTMADRSWAELKKRQKNNRLLSNNSKKKARYPAWYSIFKIRQPLLLSRIGIPICKDTTQDGIDHLGATAALLKERLAVNLAKSFNFFDVLCSARDDFLATNFGLLRAYYERDEVKERVKERITPQKVPGTEDVVFTDGAGNVIESDDIGQDDEGFFLETDQVVDVENERICLEQVLYKHAYIDPDIRRFGRAERIAFELHFSEPQFKATFGSSAFARLPKDKQADEASPKKQTIVVFEYWDRYEKEVYWWAELGNEFLKPVKYSTPEEYEGDTQPNGLYDLEHLFPIPEPLVSNQSTDEFWPIPEFCQLEGVIEEIHTIFSRLMAVTRAFRARVLYDSSIEGLQEALNEATEGDAFGVDNLAAALIQNGGSLEAVVQYIPVEKMSKAATDLIMALEQRLNILYKLTGTSDLLQGLITDPAQRTFGERQMLEKYALNQIAEPQRKMQEFVRDCYELLCEMAIKNFKDESLERYMCPRTLPPEHQQNFRAALDLLKDDRKRFRIELETDSTVALNEQYDKQMRVELVNTLTQALEKTANIAQQSPALLGVELHCLKYLIQGFRQGKMFQQEITQAIDGVIAQVQEASQAVAPPDPAQIKLEIEKARTDGELKLREYEILSKERIEQQKLALDGRMQAVEQQLEQFKIQSENFQKDSDRAIDYEKLRNDIASTQAELQLKRDELMVELEKVRDDNEIKMYGATAQERLTAYELQIKEAHQRAEEYRIMMDERERWATEQRLQAEHQLDKLMKAVEITAKQQAASESQILAGAKAQAIATPPPPKSKKKIKVARDELGNVAGYEIEGGEGYQVLRDELGNVIGYEPLGGL